jgi:hypothetical protein
LQSLRNNPLGYDFGLFKAIAQAYKSHVLVLLQV